MGITFRKHIRKYTMRTMIIFFGVSIVLVGVLSSIFKRSNAIFQEYSATNFWFRYINSTPSPVKDVFLVGEPLKFRSTVRRYIGMDMRRQDRAWCRAENDIYYDKMKTQFRPSPEPTEYISRGLKDGNRIYDKPIPIEYQYCKMCGTTIGTTDLGYEKPYDYCTKEFAVNR